MPYRREAGSTKFGKMKLGGEIRPTEKVIVQVAGQAVEVEVTKPPWADEDPELWEAQKMETAKPIATTDVHTVCPFRRYLAIQRGVSIYLSSIMHV